MASPLGGAPQAGAPRPDDHARAPQMQAAQPQRPARAPGYPAAFGDGSGAAFVFRDFASI